MILFIQSDFRLFLRHFHPLVVHLPIGFLLLAGVFFYLGRKRKYEYLDRALPITLGLSAISSLAAVGFGLLLSDAGGYDENTLFWHKWVGIGVAVFSILAWLWSINMIGGDKRVPSWMVALLILALIITGHQGGNLTHGKGYLLSYAPAFMQQLFGAKVMDDTAYGNYPESPDSTMVFGHLIQKTLDQKCVECHNDEVQRGDLNMASVETLLKGGDGGPVLVKGEPLESELLQRVTLNPQSRKFMPPKGVPMTYQEVRLLDFWIDNGISFELPITATSIPEDIKAIIEQHYKASTKKIPYVERVQVDAVPADVFTEIQTAGFSMSSLAANNNFVDVSFRGELTREHLEKLTAVKDQLTWLNLAGTGIQDEWLTVLGEFPNLTKVRLEKNEIGDEGIAHLKNLTHLESLNLYSTQVSDEGLAALEGMKTLQRLFLWQSNVTKEGAAALEGKLPGLSIDLGMDLADE